MIGLLEHIHCHANCRSILRWYEEPHSANTHDSLFQCYYESIQGQIDKQTENNHW